LPGDTVTVTGSAFPGYDVDLGTPSCALTWAAPFAEEQPLSSDCTLDGEGGLTATFTVPRDAAPGEYVVIGRADDVAAAQSLTVQAAVTVPDVRGMTRKETLAAIAAARLIDCERIVGDGVAVSQDPQPEATVPEGTCLSATLRELVPVPDLRSLTLDRARAAVEEVGLVFAGPSDGAGTVVGQQPPANDLVVLGTTVTVTLGGEPGPVLVTVPDPCHQDSR
jgi:hypothetical protein